jgi:exopolyphosphatase/guanosine-5'-triphosphate,3'-diphosphate pyrophosphatase
MGGPFSMRILSAIDIGTNTVLYSLFAAERRARIREMDFRRFTPQIGKKLAGETQPEITPQSYKQLRNILLRLVKQAERKGTEAILIGGTNPFRKARNGREVRSRLSDELGHRIEILSGNREAFLSFLGAVGHLPQSRIATVMDLGGGSTELVTYRGERREAIISLPEGAVSLTERFNAVGRVAEKRFVEFESFLSRYDARIRRFAECRNHGLTLVGGTSSALAFLKNPRILRSKLDTVLKRENLDTLVSDLARKSLVEKRNMLPFDKDRAGVIFAGAFWLRYLFKVLNVRQAVATQRGLRHGLAIEYLETHAKS